MAYSLKNIAMLSAKGATFRCLLMGISKNKALKKLNNSVTYEWGVLTNSWKEFVHLKDIDAKFYASDYYDVNVNKYGVKCRTSLRFWENKGCINKIDPYGWFQWYFRYWLGRTLKDDERQINRWKKNWWRWLEMLVASFMIIQFRSKLDKFYCTEVTN